MSVSAAMAEAFYEEVLAAEEVWVVRDDEGSPAPVGRDGRRRMPFWSKASRAQKIIGQVPAYSSLRVEAIPYREWRDKWLPGLEKDGLLIGLNWAGKSATGYDLTVQEVLQNMDARK